MERESFTFYRSFHEAIKSMPKKVRGKLYVAVMDYALYGIEPTDLSEMAYGVFNLIKPTLDVNNTRFANGKKGGRRRVPTIDVSSLVPPPAPSASLRPKYTASFEDEVAQMKEDAIWLEQGVCMKFGISACEVHARLNEYLAHLNAECADKPHPSYGDAQRHFCSWLRKASAYKKRNNEPAPDEEPPLPDYGFNGGFGGTDI